MSGSEFPESWHVPEAAAPSVGGGRYRLAAKLGEGGMAVVYRAWDTQGNDWVAIKVLLPELARKRKLRQRFENEARTLVGLDHRNIVKVLDVGTDEPLPYIVMELADGGCVIDWVERFGPMPARMAVDIVIAACKGLNAAHEQGIVHRDVKPHNILITRRGVCRLTDFGIAQIDAPDGGGMTKTGSVMGTLGYMAPEQRTDAKNVDARADVYALGATLFKLVTNGTVADLFLAEHDAEMLDGVPQPLVPVLLKATAYKPDNRYASVNDLAKALHAARPQLPPVPDETPDLTMVAPPADAPPRPPALTDPTYPPLPEWEGTQDPPTANSKSGTPAPAASALPYAMPSQDARRDDPDYIPDYVDRSSLPDERKPIDIGVDEATKKRMDAAYQRAVEAGTIDADGNPIDDGEEGEAEKIDGWNVGEDILKLAYGVVSELLAVLLRPLLYVATAAGVLALVMGIVIGSAGGKVNSAAMDAGKARNDLFSTIDAERAVVEDLKANGGDAAVLESFWFDYESADGETAKIDAAYKLISRLHDTHEYVRQFGTDLKQSKLRMSRERINKMDAAKSDYEEKMTAWELIADTPNGRLAVKFGVAPAP